MRTRLTTLSLPGLCALALRRLLHAARAAERTDAGDRSGATRPAVEAGGHGVLHAGAADRHAR